MRARTRAALLLGLALAVPAAAQRVEIVSPMSGEPLFGIIDVEASVDSPDPIEKVDFIVDGELAVTLTEPPFKATVDVGQENKVHRIRVIARTTVGTSFEGSVRSSSFTVDDTLDIELRQLFVSVMRGGRAVLDLEAEDFTVLDDGRPQEVVNFDRGDVPLTVVLLLDTSASMAGERLAAALDGSKAFLEGMTELDRAKVVLFSDRLVRTTPFVDDAALLSAALEDVTPVGGTAVNDYLYASLNLLDARPGRRVVVLFTDGVDVHSLLSAADVLRKAQRSQALVYWLFLRQESADARAASGDIEGSFQSAWRGYEENEREFELLRQAVRQSGGTVEELSSPGELRRAFQQIVRELRNQYVLGYYPSHRRHDGSWHEIKVNVPGAARVRTREGYIDD